MNIYSVKTILRTKALAAMMMAALLLSTLPVYFFSAFAASTGVTLSDVTITTEVDEQVNFVVTATNDGSATQGTYVKLNDGGAGGSFYDGTTGGACNAVTPDADDEFAITNNKGACYSNSAAGVYTISAQLIDGNGSSVTIGNAETIEITVTEPVEPLEKLGFTSICRITDGGLRFRVQNTNNDEEIEVTYDVVGTPDTGSLTVAAAGAGVIKFPSATDGADYTFFDTLETTGPGTTKLTYDDGTGTTVTLTKSANNEVCPVPDDAPVAEILAPVNGLITNSDFDITMRAIDDNDLAKMVVNLKDAGGANLASCLNEAVSGTDETRSCTVDVSALGDGDFGFKANARDDADQISNTLSQSFTIDTTKPGVQVVDPENGDVVGSDILVTGTASDGQTEIVEVKYTVTEVTGIGGVFVTSVGSGVAVGTSTWSFEPPALTSGFYRLKVQAFDAAGNWKYDYHDVQVDTDKPMVTITYPPHEAVLYSMDFTTTGTSSDNDSAIAEVKYTVTQITGIGGVYVSSIDSGVAVGTEDWQFDVTVLDVGFYRLKVQAFDAEGNWRYKYHDIEVIERPEASLEITNPASDGEVLSGEHTFMAVYTDDDDTEDTINWAIKNASCEANNTSVNVAGFGTPGYAPASHDPLTGEISVMFDVGLLDDGEYCFVVNPQETGGETDTDRETRSFIVETIIPVCELEILSDTGTLVEETNEFAVATYVHQNWTDDIPDATWVWATEQVEDPEADTTYTFVETFTATSATVADLTIAADNGYALYVNGSLVEDRLDQNNFMDIAVKTHDISSFLTDGENTFTIEVKNSGVENRNYTQNPAGVLYRLDLEAEAGSCGITTQAQTFTIEGVKWDDADGNGLITDDESTVAGWTVRLVDAENDQAPVQEVQTDGTGAYSFTVGNGTWLVEEEVETGWTQTGQYQNGQPLSADNGTFAPCSFTFPADNVDEQFNTCSFGNLEENVPESEDEDNNLEIDESDSDSDEGSGTRVRRIDQPEPLVLGEATTSYCPLLTDFMQMGATNDPRQVMRLQAFLHVLRDTFGGSENPITGTFGVVTDANVKAFQSHYADEILNPWVEQGFMSSNAPTGFVYKTTLWKINDMICGAEFPSFEGETLENNVDQNNPPIPD